MIAAMVETKAARLRLSCVDYSGGTADILDGVADTLRMVAEETIFPPVV